MQMCVRESHGTCSGGTHAGHGASVRYQPTERSGPGMPPLALLVQQSSSSPERSALMPSEKGPAEGWGAVDLADGLPDRLSGIRETGPVQLGGVGTPHVGPR